MRVADNSWVRPFGTGMSCIDTVDAECPRGVSLQECMDVCEKSPLCNAGYHVSFDHLPLESYCVPLNTTMYQNTNFLDSVIEPNNKTRLSADNGINVRVFYNENRFSDQTDLHKTSNLYFANTCYLIQNRGTEGQYFLQSDFSVNPIKETAMTVTLGQGYSPIIYFDTRISTESHILFFKNNEFSVLSPDPETNKITWLPFSTNGASFEFRDHPFGFVNENDPFQLFFPPFQRYLTTDDKNNRLTWSTEPSLYPFSLQLDPTNKLNQFTRANWNDVPRLFPKVWKNINDVVVPTYLCDNFADCTARRATALPQPRVAVLVLLVLIGAVWILVAVVRIARRWKPTRKA